MKNYINTTLAICFLSGILLNACTQKQIPDYAVFTVNLLNVEADKIYLNSSDINLSLDTLDKIQREFELDELGSYTDTLFIHQERKFVLIANRNYVRFSIKPGDVIKISMDAGNYPSSVVFEGENAEENSYLFKKSQIQNRINTESRTAKKEEESGFKKKAEKEYNEYLQLLSSSEGLTETFIANEKKDIYYGKVMNYLGYARTYSRYFGKDDPQLSDNFLDILSTIDLADIIEYKRSEIYAFMLRSYYWYELSKIGEPSSVDPIVQLQVIADLVQEQKIKDELFIMNGKIGIAWTQKLQEYYDFFMANVKNPLYRESVTNQYKDLIATQPGQPSPAFVNYENIKGTTNSLSDFKGKFVYIDVWATWCGPCKAEIPYLKEVEKLYHGKNIEFVSLSVDKAKDFEKWKKFVLDNELGGTQVIADKEFESEFVQKYQIKGIPQFILIDPEGNIVQAKAPRPSDKKLVELFNELDL